MSHDYQPKVHRLLRMLLLMQQDEAGGIEDFCAKLGVGERSIYRDLKTLKDIGVPCYFDTEAGRYRVGKDYFLPPVQLSASEALALTVLAGQVAGLEQIALTRPAAKALEKIRGHLPDRVLREVDAVEPHVDVQLPPAGPADEAMDDVYEAIEHAIERGRSVRCQYDSLNPDTDNDASFLFDPYVLSFDQRAWYVIGWHHARQAVRRLKLLRFTAIDETEERYVIPDDFSLDTFRGDAWRMVRGKDRHRVIIRFDATMAETVQDTHWHRTQEVDYEDDGSLIFRCEVEGLEEIIWWVLGYGPHAKVIEPKALAERVAALSRAAAEQYGQPSGTARRG